MVFAAARKVGWVADDVSLEHLGFGNMLASTGAPFKTREGWNRQAQGSPGRGRSTARGRSSSSRSPTQQPVDRSRRNRSAKSQETVGLGAVRVLRSLPRIEQRLPLRSEHHGLARGQHRAVHALRLRPDTLDRPQRLGLTSRHCRPRGADSAGTPGGDRTGDQAATSSPKRLDTGQYRPSPEPADRLPVRPRQVLQPVLRSEARRPRDRRLTRTGAHLPPATLRPDRAHAQARSSSAGYQHRRADVRQTRQRATGARGH